MIVRKEDQQKILIVKQALEGIVRSGDYANECDGMFLDAISALENLPPTAQNAKIDNSIAIYLAGALIAALSFHQFKYPHSGLNVISNDPKNEFFNQPFYPLTWQELNAIIKLETNLSEQEYLRHLILQTGINVLNGTMPFESKKLILLFPDLKEHIDAIQLMREKKPATMPSVIKTVFLITLQELKAMITENFTPYTSRRGFHFFGYGPHHINRAKNVLAAVNAANDIELILEILQQQQALMQNQASHSFTQVKRFKDTVGLDERWTESRNLKNKLKSPNRSSYYDILEVSVRLIQSKEKPQPSIYDQLLSLQRP